MAKKWGKIGAPNSRKRKLFLKRIRKKSRRGKKKKSSGRYCSHCGKRR